MGFPTEFLRQFADLLCETAPYLLVGFFVAGLLRVFIPAKAVRDHLGKNDLRSILKASLYGVPIPLCSCSVIPAATALRKRGASKGATASFLISTPETGVDSISVTWALLDPVMTVVRPLLAFLTAVCTGWVVGRIDRRKGSGDPGEGADEAAAEESSGEACAHDHDWDAAPESTSLLGRLREAVRYAFGPLLDDLSIWLIVGFAISALIATIVPDSFFADSFPTGLPAMLLMLLVAAPFYICATGSTPIAAALIAKGMDPGAALVFLLVGPATNATTILVVSKLLGKRALVVYLLGISGFAILAGAWVNSYYLQSGIDLGAIVSAGLGGGPGWFSILAAVLLGILLYRSVRRTRAWKPWMDRLAVTAGVVVYASTAFTLVLPGEAGWIKRFGGVTRTLEAPGFFVHWPFPIESGEIVRPDDVRSFAVGYDSTKERTEEELEEAAEVMTGDGTLLRIAYAVHYSWTDAYAAHFGLADPDRHVRAFAESALRQVVGGHTSGSLLVERRASIAAGTAARLQEELDAIGSGIRITSLNVREVHAPPDVHPAYRDVASALEDKERSSHDASRERAKVMANATSRSYREVRESETDRDAGILEARGKATRFLARLAAYREHKAITDERLRLEAIEEVLRNTRTFVLLGDDVQLDLMNVDEKKTSGIESLLRLNSQGNDLERRRTGD